MRITFSRNMKIGRADPMIYGQFLEHFHRQVYGGVYDPESKFADEDGFRTDVIEAMRRIRVPIIRWPGGCFVSAYDWHYGVGKERIPTFNKAWRVEEPNTFGTDEFVKLCRKVGCEPYICTNAGTGTAEEMSNWVEYCNLKDQGIFAKERIANGNPEPFGVKYWSIGNENWGGHEIGAKDSDEWGRLVLESAKMMQRVDPSIELSAASIDDRDWNMNLLRRAGQWLDWISIHGYWNFSSDGIHHMGYDEVMTRTEGAITDSIDRVRAYLTAFGLQNRVKIAYDEWNLRGWFHPNLMNNVHRDGHYSDEEVFPMRDRNDRNETYNVADAVFTACFLNAMLKNCDIVGMACFSPIVNARGAIFTHKDGLVLRPQFYVFELYTNLLYEDVLDTWQEDVTMLDNHGDIRKLDVIITYKDGRFAVAAVNKDAENAASFELRGLDERLTQMRIHTVNGAAVDSYNDIGREDVTIKHGDATAFDGTITLEPHSVNVIELW